MIRVPGRVFNLGSNIKLLVFDLDGTLIDSRIDLINSVNAMLTHFGRAELEDATIASYIGDGAAALVDRALKHNDPGHDVLQGVALDWFIEYYKLHKLDYTYVYPGVLDALNAIRGRHPQLTMAVLTNKPVHPSRAICEALGLAPFFFANYGGNSFATKKPDPEGLLKLVADAGATPGETVMIGDSHVDVETARNAGTRFLGCTFGLAPESLAAAMPEATVDHASEWPDALGL